MPRLQQSDCTQHASPRPSQGYIFSPSCEGIPTFDDLPVVRIWRGADQCGEASPPSSGGNQAVLIPLLMLVL